MKVLVSDFDGTISNNLDIVDPLDIAAIASWRQAGNRFAIATGRNLSMSQEILEKYHITCDFLICNNGSLIFDNQMQLIYEKTLNQDLVASLLQHPILNASYYLIFADRNGRYVLEGYNPNHMQRQSWSKVLREKEIMQYGPYYQIDTRFIDHKTMLANASILQEVYPKALNINPNVDTMDITDFGVSKLSALQYYLKKQGIVKQDVICAGDGYNDIGLLNAYRSYTLNWANDEIKKQATKVVKHFREIINNELS